MQKLMKRFHKNQKGFTLVELMVVVVIIGILVAIAIPIYGAVTANAELRACHANMRTIDGMAAMWYNMDALERPATFDLMFDGGFPECPTDNIAYVPDVTADPYVRVTCPSTTTTHPAY